MEDLIELFWRKYNTLIILGIIAIGFLSFIISFWYKNQIQHNANIGSSTFKAISPQSAMSPEIRKNNLINIITDDSTNYKYFASLYLGDLYNNENNFDEAIKVYSKIINDKKSPNIVKAFATQRIAYMYLEKDDIEQVKKYIDMLKNANLPLSTKQLEIFYNIATNNNETAEQLINELVGMVPKNVQETNNDLLDMIQYNLKKDTPQIPQTETISQETK